MSIYNNVTGPIRHGAWIIYPKGHGRFLALRPDNGTGRPAVIAHLLITDSKTDAFPEEGIDFETAEELFEILIFLSSDDDGAANAA